MFRKGVNLKYIDTLEILEFFLIMDDMYRLPQVGWVGRLVKSLHAGRVGGRPSLSVGLREHNDWRWSCFLCPLWPVGCSPGLELLSRLTEGPAAVAFVTCSSGEGRTMGHGRPAGRPCREQLSLHCSRWWCGSFPNLGVS